MVLLRALPFAFVLACGNAAPTPVAHPTTPVPAAPAAAPAGSAQSDGVDAGPSTKAPAPVTIEVTEAKGRTVEQIGTILERAYKPLRLCREGGGGKILLRLSSVNGAFNLNVEPGSSVSPAARDCVVEALTSIDLEETGGNVGGPAVKPSSFTSLITISW